MNIFLTGANYCNSVNLTHIDTLMNHAFRFGVQLALTQEMLGFSVQNFERFLGATV